MMRITRNTPPIEIAAFAFGLVAVFLLLDPDVPALGQWIVQRPVWRNLGGTVGAIRAAEYAAHFAAFFVMTGLVLGHPRYGRRQRRPVACGALVCAAVLLELAQRWFPPRSVDFRDGACNLAGVATAAGMLWILDRATKTAATSPAVMMPGAPDQ